MRFCLLYIILIFIAIGFLVLLYYSYHIVVDIVNLSKAGKPRGPRIVLISDLHINLSWISADRLKKKINILNPDLIAIAGDLAEHSKDSSRVIRYIRKLSCNKPVYICMGNHDHRAYKKTAGGIKILVNALNNAGFYSGLNHLYKFTYNKNGSTAIYNIILLDDIKEGGHSANEMSALIKSVDNAVVLCHNPDSALSAVRYKPLCVLCGHFHGGQIWLPFNLEFKLLRRERMLRRRHSRGLRLHKGIPVYISRGLGCSLIPFRFRSFPEITLIEL